MEASGQPPYSVPNDGSKRSRGVWLLLAGLVVGTGLGLLMGGVASGDGKPPSAPVAGTTLERIVDDPERFAGDRALVGGRVREILSPRAFTVGEPGFAGEELLVVTEAELAAPTRSGTRPVLEGDFVQVSGQVKEFDVAGFERDLGVDLKLEFDRFPNDDLGDRRGDPAVQADLVTFSPRTTPVAEASTAEDIVERPRDYNRKIVAVDGRVTDVLPSGALLIDGELVALTADFAQRRPREGDEVRIVGPVRRLDPDQLRTGGEQLADDGIFGRLTGRPAVVAQSIEIQ